MPFENLLGNESQKKILLNTADESRVGHSYIFSGVPGIGKKLFALEFAKLINCRGSSKSSEDVCSCLSCSKIDKNIHPDVTVLEYNEEKVIKIDSIRTDLEERIYLSPFESDYKVFIIDNAERMNFNAQNAFLKTLEEPPKQSVIILVTGYINFIAPTIRSRCQIINFYPLPQTLIAEKLKLVEGLDKEDIPVASKLANGSLGRALKINSEYLLFRKDVIRKLMDIRFDKPSKVFDLYDFMKIDSKDNSHEDQKFLLDIISLWLRDLLFLKLNYGREFIVNSDIYEELSDYVGNKSVDNLLKKADYLEECWYGLSRLNSNKKLAFEDLFLKLSA